MTAAWHPVYGRANARVGVELHSDDSNRQWVASYWGKDRIFAVVPAEEVTVGVATLAAPDSATGVNRP